MLLPRSLLVQARQSPSVVHRRARLPPLVGDDLRQLPTNLDQRVLVHAEQPQQHDEDDDRTDDVEDRVHRITPFKPL
jgi:hypothetical protein